MWGGQATNDGGPPPNSDFDLHHQGNSGKTADWLGLYTNEWATTFQPDIVLLHAGTNDLYGRESVESTRNDIAGIIDNLRLVNPSIKVLLAQIIPTVNDDLNVSIVELNVLLAELAKEKNTDAATVILVDQNTGFSTEPDVDLNDEVHPNEQGEEKIAERWYQALKTVLGKPLPVNLVQFSALSVPAGVQLQWATASEQNNRDFTIERSTTGIEFTAVGQVAGQGTTANRSSYSFLDPVAPAQSELYYRLRQTDADGAVRFSDVVTVSPLRLTGLSISPVPADDAITVSGMPVKALITICNVRGQLVYSQPAQSPQAIINISQLASGMYYMKAGGQNGRFIKQ